MKAFSWAGGFDDEAAIYVQTQSYSLWPGILTGVPLPAQTPLGSTPGFLKAEASSVEAEIIKVSGARFLCLEKDLTSVLGCHDGILFIFNFIPDLKILK